ncbi:hypothetical protein B0H21DRAFT_824064 [Amylocystis lapponica]|nr:hypothetical protein B0H21DRAFT_826076 [Amylocystis lapponica]KAH9940641.1 hypothetical protein B0H21DRAFT_824768 [Amylocystis lapponica]KAH9942688.1 hypothetical protein B0H21DRAFT_824064 [Amylocystis lapponica]
MPLPPSSSSVYITQVPRTISITAFQEAIRESETDVLQWDTPSDGLIHWQWPIVPIGEGFFKKVMPRYLLALRRTHHFRTPCCLCPYDDLNMRHAHVEAAICCQDGVFRALCAAGRCGYEVDLNAVYNSPGQHLHQYLERQDGDASPSPVYHFSELSDPAIAAEVMCALQHSVAQKARREWRVIDPAEVITGKFLKTKPLPKPVCLERYFKRLHTPFKAGLHASDMRFIFVRCMECDLYMTRTVFSGHKCEFR